jgi:hypothetical protein
MENQNVKKAVMSEIERLASFINRGTYLEVNRRDGNQWTLYKERPDWENMPDDVDECNAYLDKLRLADSSDYDFPGVSGVDRIDPVLCEAMVLALNVIIAPED